MHVFINFKSFLKIEPPRLMAVVWSFHEVNKRLHHDLLRVVVVCLFWHSSAAYKLIELLSLVLLSLAAILMYLMQ